MRQCAKILYSQTARETAGDNVMRRRNDAIYVLCNESNNADVLSYLALTIVDCSAKYFVVPQASKWKLLYCICLHFRVNNVYFYIVESCIDANNKKKEKYYSFPMAITAARTRYIITLYVHCPSYSYNLSSKFGITLSTWLRICNAVVMFARIRAG
jgi:hypothetical protein